MYLSLLSLACAVALPAVLWFRARRRHRMVCRPLHAPIFLSAEQMARIVRWECARTDRNQAPFTLAVFPMKKDDGNPGTGQQLETTLRNTARLTDVVGWLNDEALCALLVDTSVSGAKSFADKVVAAAGEKMKVSPVIYTYGEEWSSNATDASIPRQPALAMSA